MNVIYRPKSLIALLFTVASLALFGRLQYVFNPDALAYLRIASYYQQGAWGQALNGYWSPLISWLLWPLFSMGIPWLWSFHLINFLAGLLSLYKLGQILDKLFTDLSAFTRSAFLLVCAAQLLFLEYTTVTPDLLTLCLLLYLLERYLSHQLLTRPVSTGLLGALLFFAKSYCFYFFIAFISLYSIYQAWQPGLRQFPVKALLWLVCSFALPSGIWMTLTHSKYGEWQVSASAAYNFNNLDSNGVITHPYNSTHKLMPLPYPGAFCLWEDPQLTYHYSTQKGLSKRPLTWYKALINTNGANLWAFLLEAGIGWWIFLPLACLLINWRRKRPLYGAVYINLILFCLLYMSGYMLILMIGRYIWVVLFAIWILLFKAIEWLVPKRYKPASIVLLTGYCLYVMLAPLSRYFYYGRTEHQEEKAIAAAIPAGSHIATWHSKDLWTPFCQYDVHDYGGIASYTSWPELNTGLRSYAIQYLVITDTAYVRQIPPETVTHLRMIRQSGNLTLYAIGL